MCGRIRKEEGRDSVKEEDGEKWRGENCTGEEWAVMVLAGGGPGGGQLARASREKGTCSQQDPLTPATKSWVS